MTTDPWELTVRLAVFALCAVLLVAAWWRGWSPPLKATLALGLGLRVLMLVVAGDFKPYDLHIDFHRAGVNALEHRDPILNSPETGWNYLPTYALFLAANVFVERQFDVPWMVVSRIGPILFDLGVVVLVGLLAAPAFKRTARLLYAVNPLTVLVSAVHGQMEPLCLLFALGAFVLILRCRGADGPSTRRVVLAGILIALAISVKTWPALFLPALLMALPGWRHRLRLVAAAGGVLVALLVTMPLTVGTPVGKLPEVLGVMIGYHPIIGTFGWSSVVLWLHPIETGELLHDPFSATLGSIGSLLTLAAIAAAVWWWRRAHPADVAMVSASAFQVVTASHGVQYLEWAMPFATARPTRWTWLMSLTISVYAGAGYLVMTLLKNWGEVRPYYYMSGLVVIAAIVVAVPWARRWEPTRPVITGEPAPGRFAGRLTGPGSRN
ncbi:glycosyltransferase family 87 protein [Actinomadura sp. 6N118]|uniref:glycosyltransferase family 87 protein n=1 Tax=Actinomadura sp. 6N118 TaxID=3375151 RepID=UPI0037A9AEE4